MLKLLIADDEINEINALASFFGEYYKDRIEVVAQCRNGKEAIENGLQLKPDIAILDIQMPVNDGLSVARRLHEDDSRIIIIMLTAYSLFN